MSHCMEQTTTIRSVAYADILDASNARELFTEYAAECSIPEMGEANPQREMYRQMESSGMLRFLGVYQDDALIGFAAVLLYILPHYGKKIATMESLFVARSHRSGGAGKELMMAIEALAKDAGAVAILYSAPAESQLERLLTLREAYRRTNSTFCLSLR